VDAAMYEEQRCFGIAMCIQNYQCHFLKATKTWHEGSPPPQEAEAIGFHDVMAW